MHMIDPDEIAREAARQQLLLMAWFSPAFPVGGFAFSHGLEWAQEVGAVEGREALEIWLTDLIVHGSGRNDAILLAASYNAFGAPELADVIELGAALQPSTERYLEATVQGQAFLTMVQAAYPFALPLAEDKLRRMALPVAAGLCGAAHRIECAPLLVAYLSGFVANLCSAAVRLGIVGQTDGQRVIAALHPVVLDAAMAARSVTCDDLGSATFRADLFSLQHETQYSRLFRS